MTSWLTQVYGEPLRRMTKDLDLAVFIADTTQYDQLREWLLTHEQFVAATNSAFCLHHAGRDDHGQVANVVVDLLPFGDIADEAGEVQLAGEGLGRISTVGFAEVLAEAATMTTPAGKQWRVVTLPGIVVLKLLAWQDRPEVRGKDATDLMGLLAVYFDLVAEPVIYVRHLDLFDEDDSADPAHFKLVVGARVLGRQVRQLLAASPVRYRLLGLLADELALGERSRLARAMSHPGPALAACLAALAALHTGLADEAPPASVAV